MSDSWKNWKVLKPEGDRETLALWIETGSLDKSFEIAKIMTAEAKKSNVEINISYSNFSINSMINPFGGKKLSPKHHKTAENILRALQDEKLI